MPILLLDPPPSPNANFLLVYVIGKERLMAQIVVYLNQPRPV